MKTEKYTFEKKEVEQIMEKTQLNSREEALTEYAYRVFDLKHNGGLILGKVGKSFFEIKEVN